MNFVEGGPGHLTPVGLYPEGATPSGILDLLGNCLEWVGDWWRDNYQNEATPSGSRVIRGSAYSETAHVSRVSYRYGFPLEERNDSTGFRCVRDLPPAPKP